MDYLKRILAAALTACMVLSMVPAAVLATETEESIISAESEVAIVTEEEAVSEVPEVVESEITEVADATEENEETGATEETESDVNAVAADEPEVTDYDTFLANLKILETYAESYASTNSSYKVAELVINYVRTGVERYLDGNWKTLAGEEITSFVNYVARQDAANGTSVICLRNIVEDDFILPNGNQVDFGHMFGALNIAYISAVTTGDLGGWAGDLCDLLQYSHEKGNVPAGTIDEMADYVLNNCFGIDAEHAFGMDDFYGDMDAYYLNNQVKAGASISEVFEAYFTAELTNEARAEYFLNNRFSGLLTQDDVRQAVFKAYRSNIGLQVLEADRDLSGLTDLRQAVCFAFADYLYQLAGDTLTGETGGDDNKPEEDDKEDDKPVVTPDNRYYSVFSSTTSTLAPGITQTVKYAYTADNKQLAYYVATVDIGRSDVSVHANYKDNDPTLGWGMARVTDQMAAAAANHAHIENYTTVLGVNGDFYNMSTGKPSGALVMEGVTYMPGNGANFFAILDDGTPIIGAGSEWNTYKDRIVEGIGGSMILIRDGKVVVTHSSEYYNSRASRTCVGITADGQVVLMVLDGRQEPYSAGGSMEEVAQIMLDAGCVQAMNLDGGGSTTFAAKAEGSDEVKVVNSPSDGYARSVSSSLLVVSTAKISNEFDHALISTEYENLTVGTKLELTAVGVSESGSSAEIPAGAQWKVTDPAIGTITGNTFEALENGEVEVQLILADGTIAGTKKLNVVVPDNIYFTADNLSVIYGQPAEMPVAATYNGMPVAMNTEDIFFFAENDTAGIFDGWNFIGDQASGIRVTTVYAILVADDNLFSTIRVSLYSEDEAVFDFDNVTAGNRQFAWNREVSNAVTEDNVFYQIVDADSEMGLEYTFGLDMTAIEIPGYLNDLVYMLPGGDNESATAWDFLLQLAERISVLTEVRINVQFDTDLDMDLSKLTVVNEYFKLNSYEFNEETNELVLICNWVDQTAAIDPSTANPICIMSGITATPKADAQWNAANQLAIVNYGEVGYTIYLRANALYSFALQEVNQQTYNLYPFDNPDVIIGGSTEKGAYTGGVYATFSDSFVLDKTNRQGWYSYENFLYYFVDNEPLTGLQRLPGYEDPSNLYFYTFNEDGSCVGTVSGMLEYENGLYFVVAGAAKTGWQTRLDENRNIQYYYFDPATGAAVDGEVTIGGYKYTFEDHILVKGQIVTDSNGSRYRWAGEFISQAWLNIDGKTYYAGQNSYFYTGFRYQYSADGDWTYYAFAADGHVMTEFTGLYEYEGGLYYIREGIVDAYPGLVEIDGDYYYISSTHVMVKDRYYWISKPNGIVPEGSYYFDADGKLQLDGPVTPPTPSDPEAPAKEGFVAENGGIYYYVNGVLAKCGLVYVDGSYYYVRTTSGEVVTGRTYWVTQTNGLMPEGNYTFDAEGKMINVPGDVTDPENPEIKNGFVTENGGIYYYVDGELAKCGLVYVDGHYYYVRTTSGEVVTNRTYWVTQTNDLMNEGNHTFDAEGKMIDVPGDAGGSDTVKNGFVEENGGIYYYVDGKLSCGGLVFVDGYYYYVRTTSGEVITSRAYWVTYTNGMMDEGSYNFDSKGRMTNPPDGSYIQPDDEVVKNGFVTENGGIYYYENGIIVKDGLIKVDGYYYYVRTTTGEVITNRAYWITCTNGMMDEGSYNFDSKGRMTNPPDGSYVQPEDEVVKNGFVKEDGALYYYKNGVIVKNGLIKVGKYYYYTRTTTGEVITNRTYWITYTNGLLEEGNYTFDAKGRIVF